MTNQLFWKNMCMKRSDGTEPNYRYTCYSKTTKEALPGLWTTTIKKNNEENGEYNLIIYTGRRRNGLAQWWKN
jgi:hypothetical protein